MSEASEVERVSVKERWDWFVCVLQKYCAMSEEEADDLLQEFTDAVIEQECDRRAEQEAGWERSWGIKTPDDELIQYSNEQFARLDAEPEDTIIEILIRPIHIPDSTEET